MSNTIVMGNREWIIIDVRKRSALYGLNRKTLRFSKKEIAEEIAKQFFRSYNDYIIYNTQDIVI